MRSVDFQCSYMEDIPLPAKLALEESLFAGGVLTLFVCSPLVVLSLIFVTAPYGKHSRKGWGPDIPPRIAWFLMESPTLWLSMILLPAGRHCSNPIAVSIVFLYLLHYIHRTIIYPLRLSCASVPLPLSVVVMSFAFNLLNTYVQIRSVTYYADYSGQAWAVGALMAVRVAIGVGMFFWGMAVNVRSDLALQSLKVGGGYRIPQGGWFEKVSCANYMGELAEWIGWAVVAWSPAAWGFVIFTAANLVPRARSHHIWYRQKFGEDYPKSRKAVVPYIF